MASLATELLDWYDQKARVLPWRSDPTPYHVWLSEIMLQQTRVQAAISYYERFLKELPTVQDLAQADEETLLKLWEGLGYYSRVRNMQKAARQIEEQYHGQIPSDPKELRTLSGIGEYTAGAIASIAFRVPAPAVDGNVLRVFSRLNADPVDVTDPKVKAAVTEQVMREQDPKRPGDFNQALMDLGATVCLPNGQPLCSECPLKQRCRAVQTGDPERYPVKKEKKPRKIEQRTVFVIVCQDRILLHRRQDSGLLSSLWELPNLEGWYPPEEIPDALNAMGVRGSFCLELPDSKHVFSHIEWHMKGCLIRADYVPEEGPFRLENLTVLNREVALPRAFQAYTKSLEEWIRCAQE